MYLSGTVGNEEVLLESLEGVVSATHKFCQELKRTFASKTYYLAWFPVEKKKGITDYFNKCLLWSGEVFKIKLLKCVCVK